MKELTPNRRMFIKSLGVASASSLLLPSGVFGGIPIWSTTVGDIIDRFIGEVSGAPFSQTVDTLKAGRRDMEVTGVVTTMFATIDVIEKAHSLNANFIIAHEPTFYNHLDDTEWLEQDDVYLYKKELLEKYAMSVWRNHDYVHTLYPDGVQQGVVDRLEWNDYFDPDNRNRYRIPAMTLESLIEHLKKSLGIKTVRYIGNPDQSCSRILLMPGASGGRRQISLTSAEKPDVLICGEISEWETAEYIRDARSKGDSISLIVLGHADSEEPGSAFMAEWMGANFPNIPVTNIPATNPFSFR
ncbi:Nif3-like dinuclear metal center hexameric protein [Fulvivirga sedimenti]|uniref:Nif3-like dinuclear metal center hexameric protein n=1 Tax=Fulvivirga sedimenti TaxID=2879465 RepID=A0A9X1KZ44_9BACT|nr:Nif3-like dinuclear metal center hexameric protein [Fulvivirga sedimenti]MCA6074665.1 Nif3-like dinuclear metal center hexameric protein [Fulvivirga sedimenti]MCA6075842.1 Nif3-like dinuclear metal center hexameric protein [Fulvivirga sedimenti]MCA6076970.1 Nif3-like dinuclear metal center hexameric protein [Fulvivirga sedimenti]